MSQDFADKLATIQQLLQDIKTSKQVVSLDKQLLQLLTELVIEVVSNTDKRKKS